MAGRFGSLRGINNAGEGVSLAVGEHGALDVNGFDPALVQDYNPVRINTRLPNPKTPHHLSIRTNPQRAPLLRILFAEAPRTYLSNIQRPTHPLTTPHHHHHHPRLPHRRPHDPRPLGRVSHQRVRYEAGHERDKFSKTLAVQMLLFAPISCVGLDSFNPRFPIRKLRLFANPSSNPLFRPKEKNAVDGKVFSHHGYPGTHASGKANS